MAFGKAQVKRTRAVTQEIRSAYEDDCTVTEQDLADLRKYLGEDDAQEADDESQSDAGVFDDEDVEEDDTAEQAAESSLAEIDDSQKQELSDKDFLELPVKSRVNGVCALLLTLVSINPRASEHKEVGFLRAYQNCPYLVAESVDVDSTLSAMVATLTSSDPNIRVFWPLLVAILGTRGTDDGFMKNIFMRLSAKVTAVLPKYIKSRSGRKACLRSLVIMWLDRHSDAAKLEAYESHVRALMPKVVVDTHGPYSGHLAILKIAVEGFSKRGGEFTEKCVRNVLIPFFEKEPAQIVIPCSLNCLDQICRNFMNFLKIVNMKDSKMAADCAGKAMNWGTIGLCNLWATILPSHSLEITEGFAIYLLTVVKYASVCAKRPVFVLHCLALINKLMKRTNRHIPVALGYINMMENLSHHILSEKAKLTQAKKKTDDRKKLEKAEKALETGEAVLSDMKKAAIAIKQKEDYQPLKWNMRNIKASKMAEEIVTLALAHLTEYLAILAAHPAFPEAQAIIYNHVKKISRNSQSVKRFTAVLEATASTARQISSHRVSMNIDDVPPGQLMIIQGRFYEKLEIVQLAYVRRVRILSFLLPENASMVYFSIRDRHYFFDMISPKNGEFLTHETEQFSLWFRGSTDLFNLVIQGVDRFTDIKVFTRECNKYQEVGFAFFVKRKTGYLACRDIWGRCCLLVSDGETGHPEFSTLPKNNKIWLELSVEGVHCWERHHHLERWPFPLVFYVSNRTSPSLTLQETLLKACRNQVSGNSVGVAFSGGLDSTLVVALLAKLGVPTIKMFNISFTEATSPDRLTCLLSYIQLVQLYPETDFKLYLNDVDSRPLDDPEVKYLANILNEHKSVMDFNIGLALYHIAKRKGYLIQDQATALKLLGGNSWQFYSDNIDRISGDNN